MKTRDGTIFPIETKSDLFYFNLPNSSTTVAITTTERSSSMELWHKVLGHINVADLLKTEEVVEGMKFSNKKEFDCSTCVVSKQTVTRNHEADERATEPMEFVHTDLNGPVSPVAKDGFRYAINFVDDYSGVSYVYFLKQKSDAVGALHKVMSDYKIKIYFGSGIHMNMKENRVFSLIV